MQNPEISLEEHMVWRGVWGPPFQTRSHSSLVPPVIQGSKSPPFSLSILHMTPRNIFNGEMDGGHIWFWSTIKTNWKQNISNERFQTISKIKSVWLWECSDKRFSVNKRNGDGPHRIYPLPIQQMELPDVH